MPNSEFKSTSYKNSGRFGKAIGTSKKSIQDYKPTGKWITRILKTEGMMTPLSFLFLISDAE